MSVTKEEWATALRSGEYKQGHGWLMVNKAGKPVWTVSKTTAFCCIGVLGKLNADKNPDYDIMHQPYRDVVDLLGHEAAKNTIHMNDTYKEDFNKIADYIESL